MKLILIVNTKEKVDDETSSNCDTCLVEIRLVGKNSMPLDVTNHDHMCQPFCLGNYVCDIDSVQHSILKDMVSCSLSNKPSECQKIWLGLSDSLSYVVENMPKCITYTPSQGYHIRKWEANKHCVMQQNVIILIETTMINIMAYNMD